MKLVKIHCLACDGRGWIGGHLDSYGDADSTFTYWKNQETCPECKGTGEMEVDEEFAKKISQ